MHVNFCLSFYTEPHATRQQSTPHEPRSVSIRAARYLLTCAARLRASSSSPVLVVVARPTPASSSICSMRASRCVKQIWSETLVQTTSTLYAVLSSESSSVSCGVARWALACESDRSLTACASYSTLAHLVLAGERDHHIPRDGPQRAVDKEP